MPSPLSAARDHTKTLFVSRLTRLIQLHRNFQDDLNPMGLRLIEQSIKATCNDCADFGAGDQARAMLAHSGIELE
jgi:hypothetical protein